ncbi:hypothetical protein C8R45DRAFT_988395 [Mycena sanguinolenta]|nr:hypothetical protein C8R45DRAFT_988395 [Mycena sanguinolenta]
MHRSLQAPEIVAIIAAQLDRLSREGRAALVALAQCRIFHSRARCRSGHIMQTGTELSNIPLVSGLSRLQIPTCAGSLRSLISIFLETSFANSQRQDLREVFDILHLNLPGNSLLPNLEKLHWGRDRRGVDVVPSTLPHPFSLDPRITPPTLCFLAYNELSLLSTLTLICQRSSSKPVSLIAPNDHFSSARSRFCLWPSECALSLPQRHCYLVVAITYIGRLPTLEALHLA